MKGMPSARNVDTKDDVVSGVNLSAMRPDDVVVEESSDAPVLQFKLELLMFAAICGRPLTGVIRRQAS